MQGNIFDQYETTFRDGDLRFDIERKPKYILLIRILFFIIYHYFYLRYNRYGDSSILFHIARPYTEYDTFSISFLQHFPRIRPGFYLWYNEIPRSSSSFHLRESQFRGFPIG